MQVQQYLEIQSEVTQSQIKRFRHLQDFAFTNSSSILYETVLKNGGVFKVTLDGQKKKRSL